MPKTKREVIFEPVSTQTYTLWNGGAMKQQQFRAKIEVEECTYYYIQANRVTNDKGGWGFWAWVYRGEEHKCRTLKTAKQELKKILENSEPDEFYNFPAF